MAERSIEELVGALVEGTAEVGEVQLPEAVEVAEALADADQGELLGQLAERCLPRLVKKERPDEIEGIWLACCAAGALPLPLMLKTSERMVARGLEAESTELLLMLISTLLEADRAEEALEVVATALKSAAPPALLEAAAEVLERLFAGTEGLELAARRVRRAEAAEAAEVLEQAERSLWFSPGTFLRWLDQTVAQVVSTDGVTALVRHPSGSTERRPVDLSPPPKRLGPEDHEVLRLFQPEELKRRWDKDPTGSLSSLLAEQDGFLAVPGLRAILVPHIIPEAEFEGLLSTLKLECGLGHEGRPSYDSRRRMFLAPGREPPKPARAASGGSRRSSAPRASSPPAEPSRPKAAASAPVVASAEQPRWVDLTKLPEIRALISGVEQEVGELTRELNVELPVRLEEARAHGDLRENAEYDAAKERLRFVQARVDQLHRWLGQLHELSRLRLIPGRVAAMSTVVVADEASGEERTLRLVPAELPEPRPGDVSIGTPYGKALAGKAEGDVVLVTLPRRTERLEVIKVIDPE